MPWQDRWETRSSLQLQGQKMLSEGRVRRIHTQTLYILPAFMDGSRHRYPFVILIPLFFVFFVLPLDTNRLRGESSFRPEPLRKPPYEPSRVDIQFYHNFKKNIHRYTARIAQRWSSTPFTKFQRCSLTETWRWKRWDFLPRAKTWKTVRRTRNQDATHAHKRVTAPLTSVTSKSTWLVTIWDYDDDDTGPKCLRGLPTHST